MARLSGLGRGLEALMGDAQSQIKSVTNPLSGSNLASLPAGVESDSNGTLWVSPGKLLSNPLQPRKVFDAQPLQELSDSIREHGVIEPVLIEEVSGSLYIVAGERRVRAAVMAGLDKIPVQIRSYDEKKRLTVALIENIQRTDLNPIEEARAYSVLMDLSNMTQDEVAKEVGKARATVTNVLRLLKLPPEVQELVSKGEISLGLAKALLSLESDSDIISVAKKIVDERLTVREAERLVSKINHGAQVQKKTQKALDPATSATIASIEERFISKLGTKVSLRGDLSKGTIVIDYYSKADLDRLYNILEGDANGNG